MQDRLSSLGAFVSTGKHLQFAIVSQRNARHADRPGREGHGMKGTASRHWFARVLDGG